MPIAVAKHGFWWVFQPTPIVVSPPTVPNAYPNSPYSVTFIATGGSAPTSPYAWSYTGTIPPGTNFDPNTAILSGIPTTDGVYIFTITATDPNGYSGDNTYTITVGVDRSLPPRSKNILIVYDPNSIKGQYGYDVDPSQIASTITTRETSLGFIPATITSYSAFLALPDEQVANYAHIWDVGYDTLMPGDVEDKYATYLASGGAVFLLGENGYFVERDGDISNFITNMGGGSVSADAQTTGILSATVAAEFRLANTTSTVTFNNVGRFGSIGNGTVLASSGNGVHAAVWETGSLSNKLTGAIVVVLDINHLVGGDIQPDFVDNVSISLNKK
jgi:hypothetical protein